MSSNRTPSYNNNSYNNNSNSYHDYINSIMVDQINFVSSTKQLLVEIKIIIIKKSKYWDNLRFIYSECISAYFNFHVGKNT